MTDQDRYIPGVPCWVDTTQPDAAAAAEFYGGVFGWELEDVMPPESPATVLHRPAAAAATSPPSARRREGAPDGATWNTYVWVRGRRRDGREGARRRRDGASWSRSTSGDAGRMAVFADPAGAAVLRLAGGARTGAPRSSTSPAR